MILKGEKRKGVYSVQPQSQYSLGMWNVGGTVRKVVKLSKAHDIHSRHCEASHVGRSVVYSEAEQT